MAYNSKTNWQFGDTVTESDLNRIEQGIKTLDLDKASFADLNGAINAKTIDGAARVATTANITLSGLQTIDGIALTTGDRVLVKNQTTGSQNGMYVAASGSWSRSADADTTAKIASGISVYVREGTAGGGKTFVMDNSSAVTLGTTAITFEQSGGSGAATDSVIGNRTISDATTPTGDSGTITTLFGWFANMIKSITGGATWRTAPIKSLAALNTEKAPIASPTFTGTATAASFVSTAATGTAPMMVASQTAVTNLNADLVDGLHASSAATANTLVARDGNGDISGRRIISTMVQGTAPLGIASTTLVANLNADMVDGYHMDIAANPNTIVGRDNTGQSRVTTLFLDALQGTVPMVVSSSTLVAKLNADMVDGFHAAIGNFGNTVVARDGNGDFSTRVISLVAAQGAAPMVVTSTTAVTNLNADMVDGYHFDQDLRLAAQPSFAGLAVNGYFQVDTRITNYGDYIGWGNVYGAAFSGSTFASDAPTGTAPLTVASTTLVTNLNAEMVGGYKASDFLTQLSQKAPSSSPTFTGTIMFNNTAQFNSGLTTTTSGTTTFSGATNFANTAAVSFGRATGTAPFTVSSTTAVTNLNADMVDGHHVTVSTATPSGGADGDIWIQY